MGTWGTGLFDNDRALDTMHQACRWLRDRLFALAGTLSSERGAQELAAVLGLLLQFDADAVADGDLDADIRAAAHAQRDALGCLSPTTQALVGRLASGQHESLTERYMDCSPELVRATGRRVTHLHDPAFFETEHGAALACAFATHIAVCADVEFTAALPELYHLDAPIALLGMLLFVSPRDLGRRRLELVMRHRAKLREAIAREAADPGPDSDFWPAWIAHAEAAFTLLETHPRVD